MWRGRPLHFGPSVATHDGPVNPVRTAARAGGAAIARLDARAIRGGTHESISIDLRIGLRRMHAAGGPRSRRADVGCGRHHRRHSHCRCHLGLFDRGFRPNPNANSITLNVRYYQSNDAKPPAGLRACSQLVVPASTSVSFDLGTQCGLTSADDNFGMFVLEDAASPKVNPFFAYSRTQTPTGIGFSVEGFPIGNFSSQNANVLGLRSLAASPQYRSNCFVASLGEPVTVSVKLFQAGASPETQIGSTITYALGAFQTHRILDVFAAALGVAVGAAPDKTNVRAQFTNSLSDGAAFIAFCTLETSSNGSADFRIAKSLDARDRRELRLACYAQDTCGTVTATNPPEITDITKKGIHYLLIDQPDFVKCDIVAGARTNDLEIMLRGPGDPTTAPQFDVSALPPPYNAPPYTSGGVAATSFYVYTGEKSTIDGGATTRWFIDVSFNQASADKTVPIPYGITCTSGNGVSVPWRLTTGTANP